MHACMPSLRYLLFANSGHSEAETLRAGPVQSALPLPKCTTGSSSEESRRRPYCQLNCSMSTRIIHLCTSHTKVTSNVRFTVKPLHDGKQHSPHVYAFCNMKPAVPTQDNSHKPGYQGAGHVHAGWQPVHFHEVNIQTSAIPRVPEQTLACNIQTQPGSNLSRS